LSRHQLLQQTVWTKIGEVKLSIEKRIRERSIPGNFLYKEVPKMPLRALLNQTKVATPFLTIVEYDIT